MTEIGAAAKHAGGPDSGAGRVGTRRAGVVVRAEPILAPLPDVAGRLVESVAVGSEGLDWCGCQVTVLHGVGRREVSLPDVASPPAMGPQLVAPRIPCPRQPAPGGE